MPIETMSRCLKAVLVLLAIAGASAPAVAQSDRLWLSLAKMENS
jgi:hypothetical protein